MVCTRCIRDKTMTPPTQFAAPQRGSVQKVKVASLLFDRIDPTIVFGRDRSHGKHDHYLHHCYTFAIPISLTATYSIRNSRSKHPQIDPHSWKMTGAPLLNFRSMLHRVLPPPPVTTAILRSLVARAFNISLSLSLSLYIYIYIWYVYIYIYIYELRKPWFQTLGCWYLRTHDDLMTIFRKPWFQTSGLWYLGLTP